MKWRTLILWATALVIIGWTVLLTVQKEQLLAAGKPVLLKLAPVDPRSLIQGDYMQLRYGVLPQGANAGWPRNGTLVATLDEQGIVQFVRLYNGYKPLKPGEQLLNYHTRGTQVLIGAESFFFQEGTATTYETAQYGELRVTPVGETILIGLRDEQLRPLGKPAP